MTKANADVRDAMRKKRIPAWAVGAELGVHENTVLRRLRFELSTQDKQTFFRIIDKLAEQNTAATQN